MGLWQSKGKYPTSISYPPTTTVMTQEQLKQVKPGNTFYAAMNICHFTIHMEIIKINDGRSGFIKVTIKCIKYT